MRAAGIMADKAVNDIENKFSKMNPQIKTSFFGNLLANFAGQALKGAVDGVKELVDRFTDLQKTAEYAEVSVQWLYGLQAVGAKAGASFGEINLAVKSVAFQLDEMKRGGDNALKTLLEANPKFLKGVKVDALDAAGALKIVSDIMANMSKLRAVDVAKNLGLPEGTVETWRQGGEAVEKMAAAAAKAGPDLARMAEQSKALKTVWNDFLDSLQTGVMDNFFAGFKAAVAGIISILEKFSNTQEGETVFGRWADQALDKWREVGKEIDAVEGRVRIRINKPDTAVDPFARKNAAAAADDFDRVSKSIEKHTTAMQAEAATIGESAHAQEEYRVQLALSEALVNSGKEINEKYADSIATIAARAATAKQALAEAQFQMARINQAGQVLGSAISTAFADAIVEGKKLDDVLKSLVNTLLKASINATVMSLFTPGAGGTTSPFAALFKAAGGTDFAPGGVTLVGEKGPELVNLPRGSQVIPNDVLRQGGSQGGAIVYSPAIDARGASVEAVARLAQIIEADRAAFASRTVATIQQARRSRLPGV